MKPITGKIFGKLKAIRPVGGYRNYKWVCHCECGNIAEVERGSLVKGLTKSCGCLRKESTSNRFRTHGKSSEYNHRAGGSRGGLTKYKSYSVWSGMMNRCYNAAVKSYPRYGGRGITVCSRWHDPELFFLDMGDPPEGMTLERINNAGNYEPANCRWATIMEQAANKSNNRLITFGGETHHLSEWARKFNIRWDTLRARIERRGVDEVFKELAKQQK